MLLYIYISTEKDITGLIKGISVVKVSSHGSADWAVGEVQCLSGGI